MRKQRKIFQCSVSLVKVSYVLITPDKTHVRNGMNKILRILDNIFLYQISPKLTGNLELLTDIYRFGHINSTCFDFGCKVKLTKDRMTSSGVFPGIRTFDDRIY